MIFVDPIAGIGEKELAHRTAVGTVEIDRIAPFVLVAVGEIGLREAAEVIPVRPEVVVDDVEDNRDAVPVRAIDKAAELVRTAV
jgi:hypothetical protein